MADGADVTLGAKADAKSTATDTTPITAMSVLKQISASVQAPPSQSVTNDDSTPVPSMALVQAAAIPNADKGVQVLAVRKNTAASTSGTDGDYQPLITNTTGHLWVDASGQTLTVGSHAVTNAGTFAVQSADSVADGANVTLGAKADAKSTATDTTAVTAMSVLKQISASVQAPPSQAVTNAGTFAVQATAAALTDASQKTQVVDGSGNVIGATSNALDVNIKSGSS